MINPAVIALRVMAMVMSSFTFAIIVAKLWSDYGHPAGSFGGLVLIFTVALMCLQANFIKWKE